MSDPRLSAAIVGDLEKLMAEDVAAIERGVTRGVARATDGAKGEIRRHTLRAGLGRKLEKAWRSEVFPKGRVSASAAGLVYSKAAKLMAVFDQGAVIRSKHGLWLAIPTDAAPKQGFARKRINPSNFPEHRYGPLRFVYRRTGPSLLVVDNVRINKSGKVSRRLKTPITKSGKFKSGVTTVVMFTLHRQVRLKRRINVKAVANRWGDRLARIVAAELRKED